MRAAGRRTELAGMNVNPTGKGLLTPDNCVTVSIDHQRPMFLGVDGIDGQVPLNSVLLLGTLKARCGGLALVPEDQARNPAE